MKNITIKSIRSLLLILLVAQVINLGLFEGLNFTQKVLANYIFQEMTAPFLAQSPSTSLSLNR